MTLGEKIYILRRARGLSQEQLGFSLSTKENGVSRQTVSDWENNKTVPKLENIKALSILLNVSYDALLDESLDLNDVDVLNQILIKGSKEATKKKTRSLLFWVIFSVLVVSIGVGLIIPFAVLASDTFAQLSEIKNGENTIIGKSMMNRALIYLIPVLIGSLIIVIGTPLLAIKLHYIIRSYKRFY